MENHSSTKSLFIMFISSIIAGTLCGMNLFVDKKEHIKLNLNDFFMALAMTGGMFIVMSIYYKNMKMFSLGILTFIFGLYLIRNQTFINKNNYLRSMIPHHSMAIMMSKRLKDKNLELDKELNNLVDNIIKNQEEEIQFMNERLI